MPFVSEPAKDCPVEQRKLLIAVGLVTKELGQLLYPAAAAARLGTAENILYVIWLRLLQTARSIEDGCYAGYAHEQQALVRTMINASSDLIYIARQGNPTEWAVLYAVFSIDRRAEITSGYVKGGLISQEQADKWNAQASEMEHRAMAEFEKRGIRPATKHNQNRRHPPQTWSGLTDREIINKVGRGWYENYYMPFSDATHANIMSAEAELKQIQEGKVKIGPRYLARILSYVIIALADTLTVASSAMNQHFKLGHDAKLAVQDKAVRKAVEEYASTLPPGDFEPSHA
jgi:hypothetical protein